MNRTTTWNRIWLLGAAPLAAVSIIGGGIVFAQSSGTATPTTPSTVQADRLAAQSDYIKALAGNLNISEQTLRDAMKKTNLSFLDKAVTAGKITKEMADKIRADIESGQFGFFAAGGGPGGHGGHGDMGGRDGPRGHFLGAEFATFLGITDAQLRTELTGGKTIAQVAEAHGKSRAQVTTWLIAQRKVELDKAVADGKRTQAQADAELKTFTDNIATMLDGAMKPGMGGPGGPGGPGRGRGPQGQPGQNAPSTSGTN